MKNAMHCPVCAARFESGEEDFCPNDGARLLAPPVAAVATLEVTPNAALEKQETAAEEIAQPELAAVAPTGTTPAAGKLQTLIQKLGLYKKSAAPQQPSGAAGANFSSHSDAVAQAVLPIEAQEMGWRITDVVASTAALDQWPVTQTAADGLLLNGVFKRIRSGALTPRATYQALLPIRHHSMPRLWHHGTANWGGSRVDFELTSAATGLPLTHWFAQSGSSQQRAMHLMPLLAKFLNEVAELGFSAYTLDPSNLAIATSSNNLCLIDASAITLIDRNAEQAPQYKPELARSALIPKPWAAPELTDTSLLCSNSAVFSAGQLLATALWGNPLSHGELRAGAVPFAAIEDQRLSRVLMGCLWPTAAHRWTLAQLLAAITADLAKLPDVGPWASLAPGAATQSFTLNGQAFWRTQDLLEAAVQPSNWTEASTNINRILDWANTTAWKGQVALLRDALTAGRSADWVLLRVHHIVRPMAPITWRNLDISDAHAAESLAALAQGVLANSAADRALIEQLFKADLREALAA